MAALKLPNTSMVVTTDVGDLKKLHPSHKKEVSERLALWALSKNYGRRDIEPSGPIYTSVDFKGNTAILHFGHTGKGLQSNDGQPLSWFTLPGDDGVYYPANTQLSGNTVIVTCPQA